MSTSASVWLVLIVAIIAANLPFINERILIVGPRRHPKRLGFRLLELVLMGALTVGLGFAIEARLGQIAPQGWEFYAALGCLFLTLAFPGFVWRYLRRRG
jgi:hypothetical protein